MPYIITRCWYPPRKADEVVKKYFEVMEKYPPDETLGRQIVPVATTTSNCGYETMSVTEVEREKVGDALERQKTAFIEFRKIEGFNYEIKIWTTAEEGFARMGLGG
jgi:hypothetical protein